MIDDHPSFTWSNLTEKNLKFTETFWKCQCELCKMFYITQSQPSYKSLISYLIPVEIGICITIISIYKMEKVDISLLKIILIVLNVIKN